MINLDIKEFKGYGVLTIFLGIITLVIPGAAYIYIFKHSAIYNLTYYLLGALIITGPLLMVNTVLSILIMARNAEDYNRKNPDKKDESDEESAFFISVSFLTACFATTVAIMIPSSIGYFTMLCDYNLHSTIGFSIVVVLELIFFGRIIPRFLNVYLFHA